MMKNTRMYCVCAAAFLFLSLSMICRPDIAVWGQDTIADPFEDLPGKPLPDCDKEYRFKYDVEIKNVDDFIALLKSCQFEGDFVGYKPEREKLIPRYTFNTQGKKLTIELNDFKAGVKVYDIGRSLLSNKKLYKLEITYQYFDKEMWPWWLTVQASDKGCVSVVYCAAK
ncbi:MAG: hypothetical protein WC486_05450 [Candidatus Omnitrophota bacterium]